MLTATTTLFAIQAAAYSAAEQMAVDEALFQSLRGATSERAMAIRCYTWSRPAISLGYAQRIEKSCDPAACDQRGIDVVRRMTGGGTVFHGTDLTITLCGKSSFFDCSPRHNDVARWISTMITRTLKEVGINAVLYMTDRRQVLSGSCFVQTADGDITVKGKKIFGKAARWRDGAFIYQCYIPFSVPRWPVEVVPALNAAALEAASIGIADSASADITPEELSGEIIKTIRDQSRSECIMRGLSDEEKRERDQLLIDKYTTKEWTFLR